VRFGFVVPHADARDFAQVAALGERRGWDGEFVQLSPSEPAAWEAAGATWWVESWWNLPRGPEGLAEVRRRVRAGPPS
jgi:hypothetical protein